MSSSAQQLRGRTASINSGRSGKARTLGSHMGSHLGDSRQDLPPGEVDTPPRFLEPCAATASMFLYAQGNSIVCCHHDTLTIERRFSSHQDEVQVLAVDNLSDIGRGRLVVSYDASQTAIVWDLMTGEEVARFVSYEHLTCASWMRSGNVAFGNAQGSVILFEPTTSEHLSSRTLDQIAVTAIAPAADCRTFAIGYQNGSLLVATTQPRFTILHNLTTNRAPSPIASLAWHASSTRQKSDMLAVQTNDGDLRVWSVSKAYTPDDPAKVVRILRRTEDYRMGANWMGWSKNGRIIQYSENETVSWDVRTKHVTFDSIPTTDNVRGLAVFGPGASLFTLCGNSTVQQFDLNAPAQMVANVQHPANLLPPSPPISLEEADSGTNASQSEAESMPIRILSDVSESENEQHMSPLARLIKADHEPQPPKDRYRRTPPSEPSSNQSLSSISMSSTSSRTPGQHAYPASMASRGMTENTFISSGSSMRSSAVPQYQEREERDSVSISSMSSISMTSSHNRPSRHRPSRLRHEVPRSPEDAKNQDLFKFTRSRLSDVPYRQPYMSDNSRLTNDDLRRQMLSTIFGWNKEIDDLIRDEISRHPVGSTSRMLLAKWLGDITEETMAPTSEMTSADWMKLALLGMSGSSEQSKLGRAYIPKLLETGDVHTAVTMLIGYGDHNDAIEIYVSHKRYMEALILTCLLFPAVWERQEAIIKKWGEWLVQHHEQQLAIRCFACTGKESTEPWTSPSAAQVSFPSIAETAAQAAPTSIPEILSPPLSPPRMNRGPQRSVAKSSSLKLITTFGDKSSKSKFFSGGDNAQTPIAAGPTPIADARLGGGRGFISSPMPYDDDPATAVLRPSNRSQFNTPASARPTGGFSRNRLPSIGETPGDSARPQDLTTTGSEISDNDSQYSYRSQQSHHSQRGQLGQLSYGMHVNRTKSASPQLMKKDTQKDALRRKDVPPPSPSPQSLAALMSHNTKNGPRSRIPDGVDLQLPQLSNPSADGGITSPEPSVASSTRYHWPSRRRGPGSVASSVSAASSVARSHRGRDRGNHSGKTLDDYLNNMSAVTHKQAVPRVSSRGRERDSSQPRKPSSRDVSQRSRGRAASRGIYTPLGPKRSPTSPIPMSPEDLISLATPGFVGQDSQMLIDATANDPASTVKKASLVDRAQSKSRNGSRNASRTRSHTGRERSTSRRPTPLDLGIKPTGREGSVVQRSPTSPVPMSATNQQHLYGSDSEDDFKKAIEAKENFRSKRLTGRSRSRGINEPASPTSVRARGLSFASMEPPSPAVGRHRGASFSQRESQLADAMSTSGSVAPGKERSESQQSKSRVRTQIEPLQIQTGTGAGDFRALHSARKTDRQLKKEAAARELEERRKSLASRAMAAPITHPDQLSPGQAPSMYTVPDSFVPPKDLPMRSATASPGTSRGMHHASRGPIIGLPATPKAMRLVLEPDHRSFPVPAIPASFQQSPTQSKRHSPSNTSPQKTSPAEPPSLAPLTLLPATVYTPPPQPPARSASAPPVEPLVPDMLRGGSAMNMRGLRQRKGSMGEASAPQGRRPSYPDNRIPPPPPPAPVMLKELAHLAMPPPPPPAPLPYAGANKPVVYGGTASGMIEIVMDDDNQPPQSTIPPPPPPPPPPVPVAATLSDAHVPIIAAPAPPSSRNGHRRGRSSVDNSIAGRISRATERMRSASRSRAANNGTPGYDKLNKSPVAPYESIPPPPPPLVPMTPGSGQAHVSGMPPLSFSARNELRSPVQGEYRTGLHQSEMI